MWRGDRQWEEGRLFEETTAQKLTSGRLLSQVELWRIKKIEAENTTCVTALSSVRALSSIPVELKFMCLMHNEAEQTLSLE